MIFCAAFLAALSGFAQPQGLVITAGSTGDDQGNSLAIDGEGKIVVAGRFNNTFTFGSKQVSSLGSYDIFLARLDSTGEPEWLRTARGPGSDRAYGVLIDARNRIYLTGATDKTTNFDDVSVVSTGGSNNDFFLAQYASDGTLQWVRNAGSVGFDQGYDLALLPDEQVLAAGWFHGTAYFGDDTLRTPGTGDSDVFVLRYSPSGEQTGAWQIHGTGSARAYSIATDRFGNGYVTGLFSGELIAGADTLHSRGNDDIFLARLSPAGEWLWVRQLGSRGRDQAFAVEVDPEGFPVLAGLFSNRISAGEEQLISRGDTDILIVKFTPEGEVYQTITAGSGSFERAQGLAIAPNGDIFVTGVMSSTASFEPFLAKSRGALDIFIAKYNRGGELYWVKTAGSSADDWGHSVAVDPQGRAWLAGQFRETARFGEHGITSTGSNDVLVARADDPRLSGILAPDFREKVYVNQDYWVDILVDSLENLNETTFSLTYTAGEYITVPEPLRKNVVLGPLLEGKARYSVRQDEQAGKLYLTIALEDTTAGLQGKGILARVRFSSAMSTPFNTEILYSFSDIYARDPHGNAIFLRKNERSLSLNGLEIWPGDTNLDGVVNQADVLPLGQFWNHTGPARPQASLRWQSQLAVPWQTIELTYADADGDGVISARDIFPIALNWKQRTGTAAKSTAGFTATTPGNTPPLPLSLRLAQNSGRRQVMVSLDLRESRELFGLAVRFRLGNGVRVEDVRPGMFFEGRDILFIEQGDGPVVEVALSLRSGSESSARNGSLVTFLLETGEENSTFDQVLQVERITAIDAAGELLATELVTEGDMTTAVSQTAMPRFYLYQNEPNPFNPETRIRFQLAKPAQVRLVIRDNLGRIVRTLLDEQRTAGEHSLVWNGRDSQGRTVASGVYFYQLQVAGSRVQTRKMLMMQ